MWGFIIGAAWYFSQQYRNTSPTPEQEEAMWDAAKHYSDLKQKNLTQPHEKPTEN